MANGTVFEVNKIMSSVQQGSVNALRLKAGYVLIVDKDMNVLNVDNLPGSLLVDDSGQLIVTDYNDPSTGIPYASQTTAGIIKVGDGLRINSNTGVLSIYNLLKLVSENTQTIQGNIIFNKLPTSDATPTNDNELVTKKYVDNSGNTYRLVEPSKGTFRLEKKDPNNNTWINAGSVVLNIISGASYGRNNPLITESHLNSELEKKQDNITPLGALSFEKVESVIKLLLNIVSGDKILSQDETGLKSSLSIKYDSDTHDLSLNGINDSLISKVNIDDFASDKLTNIELVEENDEQILKLTFTEASEDTYVKSVNLTKLYNIYSSDSLNSDKVVINIDGYKVSASLTYVDASDVKLKENLYLSDIIKSDWTASTKLADESYVNNKVITITTGDNNGSIKYKKVGDSDQDYIEVPVKGLDSAAYTPSTDYATAAQGSQADAAIQRITKGTEGSYVNLTIGNKTKQTTTEGGYRQSVGVSLVIKSIAEASADNKGLLEANDAKGYINSAIQTNSANFRGSWDTWTEVPTNSSEYPPDYSGSTTPTTNDYMVVQDASGYPVEQGIDPLSGCWRFKYSGSWTTEGKSGWLPEYRINEEPLTEEQQAALNSGVTSTNFLKGTTETLDEESRFIIDNYHSIIYNAGLIQILGSNDSVVISDSGVTVAGSNSVTIYGIGGIQLGEHNLSFPNITGDGVIATQSWVSGNYVDKTTNQTIGGTKTFSTAIRVTSGTDSNTPRVAIQKDQITLMSNSTTVSSRLFYPTNGGLNETLALRSDTKVFPVLRNNGESDSDAISRAIGDNDLFIGNIVVIKTLLATTNYEYTGYVYDGTNWVPFNDKYDWDKVIITEDIMLAGNYTSIGNWSKGSTTGTTTKSVAGRSVKSVLTEIFTAIVQPTVVTQPSVTLTAKNNNATFSNINLEVGTTINLTYTASLSAGAYTAFPNQNPTGVTAKTWLVKLLNNGVLSGSTKNTNSGDFGSIVIGDPLVSGSRKVDKYQIDCTATYDAAPNYAKDNLGNITTVRVAAGNKNAKSNTITAYRKSFWGSRNEVSSNLLTSEDIRLLSDSSTQALSNGSTFNISIPVGAMSVVFAYPATLEDVSSVLDINGLSAEIKSAFTKVTTINVEGADGYTSINYKIYYLNYAEPNATANTYKVTI